MSVLKIMIPHEAEKDKKVGLIERASILTISGTSYREKLDNLQKVIDALWAFTNVGNIGIRLEDEEGNQITSENEEF